MKTFLCFMLISGLTISLYSSPLYAVLPDPGELMSEDTAESETEADTSMQVDGADPARTADIDQAFRYGKAFIESRLYQPAILQLEQVLEVLPNDVEANYYMGLALSGLEQASRAQTFFETTIELDADHYAAIGQLGMIYINNGEVSLAENMVQGLRVKIQNCQDACPNELTAVEASLSAALNAGKSTAVNPSSLLLNKRVDAAVLYRDAIALVNQQQFQLAITMLKKTSAEYGPHPDILTYLGFSHRKQGDYEQAIHYYRQALTLNPAHKPANEYLGELYVELGDIPSATRQLEILEQLCPFSCYEKEELERWISQVR